MKNRIKPEFESDTDTDPNARFATSLSVEDDDLECNWTRARLSAFVNGDLPRHEQTRVREHIRACDTCVELFAEQMDASLCENDGIDAEPVPDRGIEIGTFRSADRPPEFASFSASTQAMGQADAADTPDAADSDSFEKILADWDSMNRESDT